MVWIYPDVFRLFCPCFDDEFVSREAFEGFETATIIIGLMQSPGGTSGRFLKATMMTLALPPDLPRAPLDHPSSHPRTGGGQALNLNVNTVDSWSAGPVRTSETTVRFCHLGSVSGLTPYRPCRCGATMQNLARSASLHRMENII
jgi:hypothetical protein